MNHFAFRSIFTTMIENSIHPSQFEEALKWQIHFQKKAMGQMSELVSGGPYAEHLSNFDMNGLRLTQTFSYYSNTTNLDSISASGHKLANYFIDNYKDNRKEFVKNKVKINEYIFGNPSFDTLLHDWKNDKDKFVKAYERDYDLSIANELNSIAWTFYEKIDDKKDLKSALKWSKKSVDLSPNSANTDTYAHLHYKLGKIEKAIKYEQQAIDLAKTEGNLRNIENFELKLLKFKSK